MSNKQKPQVTILGQVRENILNADELAQIHKIDADAAELQANVNRYGSDAHVARRREQQNEFRSNPTPENTAKLEAMLLDADAAKRQNDLIRTEMKHALRQHFAANVARLAVSILERAIPVFDAEQAALLKCEKDNAERLGLSFIPSQTVAQLATVRAALEKRIASLNLGVAASSPSVTASLAPFVVAE